MKKMFERLFSVVLSIFLVTSQASVTVLADRSIAGVMHLPEGAVYIGDDASVLDDENHAQNPKYRESITASEVVGYMTGLVGKNNEYIGWCLLFVSKCWENLGFPFSGGWGNATHFADCNTVSTSMDNIPVGADVYFTSPDGNGHIGVYVGEGYFVHAGAKSVYEKTSIYENYYKSRYRGWGWHPDVSVVDDISNVNLDVGATLEGEKISDLSPYASFDMFINGSLYKSGIGSFHGQFKRGTTYEIKNIKLNRGYAYSGIKESQSMVLSNTRYLQNKMFSPLYTFIIRLQTYEFLILTIRLQTHE